MDVLGELAFAVANLSPEHVLLVKSACILPEDISRRWISGQIATQLGSDLERVRQVKRPIGKEISSYIIGLRDEYLDWKDQDGEPHRELTQGGICIGYRPIAPRFDCLHEKPIKFEGIITTNWHQALDELARIILRGAWRVIHPFDPFDPSQSYTDEQRGWPSPPNELREADMDEMAAKITRDGRLTPEKMEWLEAALEQEYARGAVAERDAQQQAIGHAETNGHHNGKPSANGDRTTSPAVPTNEPADLATVGRLLYLSGDGTGVGVMRIARDTTRTVNERLYALVILDQRYEGYDSPKLAELCDVTDAAIRKTEFWTTRKTRRETR
jgi:hypothetical protein